MSSRASTKKTSARLSVKVIPGSARSGIAGWLGENLKVRVRAPAERGKANAALVKTLADALGVPEEHVRIARGHASPRKMIEISGLSKSELHDRLGRVISQAADRGRPE